MIIPRAYSTKKRPWKVKNWVEPHSHFIRISSNDTLIIADGNDFKRPLLGSSDDAIICTLNQIEGNTVYFSHHT